MTEGNAFKDFEVYDISAFSCEREAGYSVERLAWGRIKNGLLYLLDGEAVFYCVDGEVINAGAGELLLLPKHARYRLEYVAPKTSFTVVNFDAEMSPALQSARFSKITLLECGQHRQKIAEAMRELELCGFAEDFHSLLRKKEVFYRLLGMVFESSVDGDTEEHSRIFQGVCLLEQTYLENRPISDYAAACNININTFRRLFGIQFGMSPVKYRNYLRLNRARALLTEGFTVSEAAYACGFESVGYFCRYYRKIVGMTPGETRRLYFGD